MAKTFTAPFAQAPKTTIAVPTLACVIGTTNAPTNVSTLCTAGADGALVTRIMFLPRGTITATGAYLFISKDAGTTKMLIDAELVPAYTLATTTSITRGTFTQVSEAAPIRLEAGDILYIGIGVAQASGITFRCESTDF